MSIIVICGVSQCYSEEVSKQVADSLSYVYVGNEIFDSTAKKYKISREDIDTVLSGNTSMFGISEKERRKYISYLKYELAEIIVKDNVVINNLTSYLLPKELNHILRACLVGDFEWRVKQLTTKGKSDKHARNILKSEDSVLFDWVNSLHGLKPWSRRLFDIIEPMQNNSIEKAVDIIVKNAQKPIFRVDEKAIKLMNDFALASKVVAHCATQRHEVDVQADAGKATIYLRTFTLRMKSYKEELKKIALEVDGVKEVEIGISENISLPSVYPALDFDIPKKVMLVDDEVEFVQTLSERLQTRKYDSKIAYNGEEALASMEEEQPEVMVLDLKMPGISGFDVLREVKAKHPDTEVIILTGHGSSKEEELAYELGAFAYLEKPVDINILSKTMNEAYAKINRGKSH